MREIDRNTAIILSGGGAYGAYEVGVMKALFTGESAATRYAAINPGILTGTSVGAVNSSILLSDPEADLCDMVERLEHTWTDVVSSGPNTCGNGIYRVRGDVLKFLSPSCYAANPVRPFVESATDTGFFARDLFLRGVNFLMSGGGLAERTLELIDVSALISREPIENLLRELVALETLRRSPRCLRIIVTNWDTGELRIFNNADLTDEDGYSIILGSAAIPGFFRPHFIAGQPYVDGGLLMNTPLKPAIEAGAVTLHVIYMDPDVANVPLSLLQSTLDVFDRFLLITSAARTNEDIETARWINRGLEAIQRITRGEYQKSDLDAAARVAREVEA
ncbi:MAG TPA: patatin-like phospholipase family protein, partial [Blastocatellia bacterium]|nr:patatin-like phospholipase family protein [Blastocatellia bacterium]